MWIYEAISAGVLSYPFYPTSEVIGGRRTGINVSAEAIDDIDRLCAEAMMNSFRRTSRTYSATTAYRVTQFGRDYLRDAMTDKDRYAVHQLLQASGVVEPKTPEDVYKTHLEKRPAGSSNVDSARQNLASTFVNAFMNVGFGTDKLLLTEGNKWLYKNKEHGMMSAAASLGALLLWPNPNPNPTPTPGPSLVDLGGDLVRDAQVAQHPRELRLHRV